MHKRPGFPARLHQEERPSPPPVQSGAIWQPTNGFAAASFGTAARAKVPLAVAVEADTRSVRERMVQRLAQAGIRSPEVLAAMRAVERHQFVDSALANRAYEDTSLPIGLAQTISKPSVVARMLELLQGASREVRSGRVLEIGTGCGYQTAVLARLAGEVYSIERLRALHERARGNLRTLRLANVHLLFGDGMLGFPGGAPYTGILAAAGGTAVPSAWCDQLCVGGRLVAPVADSAGAQSLVVVDRTAHGWKEVTLEPVHFVPLKSGTS